MKLDAAKAAIREIQSQIYERASEIGDLIEQDKLIQAGLKKNELFELADSLGDIQNSMTFSCITTIPTVSSTSIVQCGDTLQGSSQTLTITDPAAPSGRVYDWLINGVDAGPSSSSLSLTLPTATASLVSGLNDIEVYCSDDNAATFTLCADCEITVEIDTEKEAEFTPDLAFGSVTQTDWQNWMDGVATGVENPQELSTQSGVLRARYAPNSEGSLHIQAFGELPEKQCYEMEQIVRLESGWDFVKAVKLGTGVGGGSPLLSGGDTGFGTPSQITTGFTVRFNLFGNDNTVQGGDNLGLYTYHVNRPNQFGEDISMNYKMPINQDVHMRARICVNDPGQANGTLEGWVDGVQTMTRTGLEFMTGNPVVDRCIFSTFFGGADPTFAPSTTVYGQFSEVKFT